MKIKPYKFQQQGIDYAFQHRYTIIGDEMGLGKTVQGLGLIEKVGLGALVVCPAFLVPVWEREIEKFSSDPEQIKVISYSKLKTSEHYFRSWADLIIADEIHYLKNPRAQRTQAFHYYINKYKPEYLLGLTGTPIKNRVTEFYSLLVLMGYCPSKTNGKHLEKPYHSYTGFCNYFSYPIINKFHGNTVTTYEGVRNVPELKNLLRGKYIRRKAKEVLELPEISRINIPASKVVDREDRQLKEAWDNFHGKKNEHFSSVKAQSALLKCKFTADYVNNLVEQGESVVIFTDHVLSAQELHQKIKNSVMITGSTSMADRNRFVEDFNSERKAVLIGTIGTTSVGYTLTVARHVVFNDLPWVPGDIVQAEKRIHRIGQDRRCFIHRIYRSRIDFYITEKLTGKIEEMGKVL